MEKDAGNGSAGREALAALVGEWDAHVQVFQGPAAAANESKGRMVNALVLGGRYLEQRYRGQSEAMEGTGYWGFNEGAGVHEYVWMDTMSSVMMTGRGEPSRDGRVLNVAGEVRAPGGQDLRFRSVLRVVEPDRHTYEIFFTRPGGEEFRSLHITYTRRAGA